MLDIGDDDEPDGWCEYCDDLKCHRSHKGIHNPRFMLIDRAR